VNRRGLRCLSALALSVAIAACGGGSPPVTPPVTAIIGAAGGTLSISSGAKVVIPPGALSTDITIGIEQTGVGAPPLPGGFTIVGQMFAFTPHGQTFAAPVTITLPFNPASVPAGGTPELYKNNAQNQWEPVVGATFGSSSVNGSVTSFSFPVVVVPALVSSDPLRIWEFLAYPGDGGQPMNVPGGGNRILGVVDEIADFGGAAFDEPIIAATETLPTDGRANGHVYSSANGVSYSVLAEAPTGRVGSSNPIGSKTKLKQFQSFVKLTEAATLSFTLTDVRLEAADFNTRDAPTQEIRSEVLLSVGAYKFPREYFYYTGGKASVRGREALFTPSAQDESFSRTPLWTMDQFDFTTKDISYNLTPNGNPSLCVGKVATLELKKPRKYVIDLSSVKLNEIFTLRIDTYAETDNRRGGPKGDCESSYARAYLRDPLEIGGGTLEFSGLEPSNQLLPEPPTQPLVEPAPCVPGPGPNPAAGVLQFGAASYIIDEFPSTAQTVMVTRTGGSTGAVTATFATSDGTAVAGTDYTAQRATVFFADGDTGQRLISVPIIPNSVRDDADKTLNLTLSQPGGCAALGSQTSTVLTIRDDEPPLPSSSFLDSSFGIAGKASAERFGGGNSAAALQADGKIVMVGGSTSDFVLARFNANGTLDPSFDGDGKVITDMIPGGIVQETAKAVAIQPDGKIVVVGDTRVGLPFAFALARYNPDGTLDSSFGNGGKVTSGVSGRTFAVVIQPDGSIVVAGDDTATEDFRLARYTTNGSLDSSFGSGGQVTTDLGGSPNTARNIVLLPDGKLLASGDPFGNGTTLEHTDLVQYTANGTPDGSFGAGGKITLSGQRVGRGLIRQPDGKLILVGSLLIGSGATATTDFAVMRLNANGVPDSSFGSGGLVTTEITALQQESANDVTLQPDGKILVVGQAGSQFGIVRYTVNGTLDITFGNGGKVTVDFFGFTDIAESVLVQPDGKIVVSGLAQGNFNGYGLARLNP
jgi:uncharacterized delta-60 repeat protein